jgi:peptidoglycan-associated lipoprotein
MTAKLAVLGGIALAIVAVSTQARAQGEAGNMQAPMPGEAGYVAPLAAPTNALDLVVGTGYTQGFGRLEKDVPMSDVATPGIAVDLGIGYRFDPRWVFSVVGEYQEFVAERASAARGMTAGLAIGYHFSPYTRIDPWLQFSTGYRLLWETQPDPTPNLLTHGFEPAKLTVGFDARVSRDVAISPLIGVDLTVPLWQSTGGATSVAISDPRPAAYVFAGLQARFDMTSTHVPVAQPTPAPVQTTAAEVAPPPAKPVSPSVSVSDEVLKACNDLLGNVDTAPKFDFDKSVLKDEDIPVLTKIAECFSTGPLKDANMLLIGRADPRGSTAYNEALGMRRANSVATFLEDHGVKEDRIEKQSRGEADATGTDEAGWARDRRVDVTRVEITVSHR